MGYRRMKPADLLKAKHIIRCASANIEMLRIIQSLEHPYKNNTIIEQTIVMLSYVSTLLGCTNDESDSDSDYEFDCYEGRHIKPNRLDLTEIIRILQKLYDSSTPSDKAHNKLEKIRRGLDSIL